MKQLKNINQDFEKKLTECLLKEKTPDNVRLKALMIPETELKVVKGEFKTSKKLLYAAISIAAMLMLISATLICRTLFFVPGVGLVENRLLDIYSTLEPVEWGKTTLESVIRYDDAETGKSTLTIFFDGLLSSPLTATTEDGKTINIECDYEKIHNSRTVTCDDFPKTDKFTLSMGYKEVDVTLFPVDGTKYAQFDWPEFEGIKMTVYPLNSTNTIFVREFNYDDFIKKYGIDIDDISTVFLDCEYYGSDGKVYNGGSRYGNICRINCPSDITIEGFKGYSIQISLSDDFVDSITDDTAEYSGTPLCKMTIPVDGEEYTFPKGTTLFELDGKRCIAEKVVRNGNDLCLNYKSEVLPDADASLDYIVTFMLPSIPELNQYGGGGGSDNDGNGSTTWTIKNKNSDLLNEYTGKEVSLYNFRVNLQINGEWKLDFLK